MPRPRLDRQRCWSCGTLPSEQGLHDESCSSYEDGDCGCDCGGEDCEACVERRKWLILTARLRNDVRKLEEAGLMMETLVKYSRKVKLWA